MGDIDLLAHKLMISAGILMYVFGSIGNILNIWVFTIWSRPSKRSTKRGRRSQTSNSALYLLAASISNLIVIIYPLLTRIMFDGYQYRVTKGNVLVLCQLRFYVLHTFDLISLTCICMATLDRYLISSRKVRWRKLSTRRERTKLIIVVLIVLIGIHGLPIAIFYDVSPTGQCIISSLIFLYYYLYAFQIVLHGIVPIIFLSVFVFLILRKQLTQIRSPTSHQHHAGRHGTIDSGKQLSRMLLLMSIAIILSSTPYCIEQYVNILFIKENRFTSSYFFLFHVISHILYYTNPVSSFYVYFISTPNFRIQIQKILFCRRRTHYVVCYQAKSSATTQITAP